MAMIASGISLAELVLNNAPAIEGLAEDVYQGILELLGQARTGQPLDPVQAAALIQAEKGAIVAMDASAAARQKLADES